MIDEILTRLNAVVLETDLKKITLVTHPFIESYINRSRGFFKSLRKNWQKEHKIKLDVIPDSSLQMIDFFFQDEKGEQIVL